MLTERSSQQAAMHRRGKILPRFFNDDIGNRRFGGLLLFVPKNHIIRGARRQCFCLVVKLPVSRFVIEKNIAGVNRCFCQTDGQNTIILFRIDGFVAKIERAVFRKQQANFMRPGVQPSRRLTQ